MASAPESEFFTLGPVPDNKCVAMCDGNLGSAGLISSLILDGFIREQTFTVDISVSEPDSTISIHTLFPVYDPQKRCL